MSGTVVWFVVCVLVQGAERVVELFIARRNRAWAFARGGQEFGAGHYPWMVALHTSLLVACLLEVGLAPTPVSWAWVLSFTALVLVTNALRYWVIVTLGPLWNTRVICVPGAERVTSGPFRWLTHPNYVAVVVEVAALPLIHGAWRTALFFTLANAAVLTARIRIENDALRRFYGEASAAVPRIAEAG